MGALRNGQARTVCTLLAVAKEAILLLCLPARESFWGAFFQKGPVLRFQIYGKIRNIVQILI
jgi:hypothetical protein